jgi:hypothetical protein
MALLAVLSTCSYSKTQRGTAAAQLGGAAPCARLTILPLMQLRCRCADQRVYIEGACSYALQALEQHAAACRLHRQHLPH